jgi:hypothetical protein
MHDHFSPSGEQKQIPFGPSLTSFERDLRRRRPEPRHRTGLVSVALALSASAWERLRSMSGPQKTNIY